MSEIVFNCRGQRITISKSLISRVKRFETLVKQHRNNNQTPEIFINDNPNFFNMMLDVLLSQYPIEKLNDNDLAYLRMCQLDKKFMDCLLIALRKYPIESPKKIQSLVKLLDKHMLELLRRELFHKKKSLYNGMRKASIDIKFSHQTFVGSIIL